jgi:hypothetical protein
MKAYLLASGMVSCVLTVACSGAKPEQPPSSGSTSSATILQVASSAALISAPPPVKEAPAAVNPASTSPKVVVSDVTEGPFRVGDQSYTFVKHVQKVEDLKSGGDLTVEWWELRDVTGKPVHRQQYPVNFGDGTFANTEDVDARELKASLGQGILLSGGELPSAPSTGWWVQVFGLSNGKLTPLGAPMSTEGGFLGEDVESYQPTPMFRGQRLQTVPHDVLKFRVWAGNFSIVYSVILDWIRGTVRPASTCYRITAQGQVSACRYIVEADPVRSKEMTFVRLFPEPEDGFTPKHVVVKTDSKIEYIEAEVPISWSADRNNISFGVSNSSKVWLHIKVDGRDGWISGEEDFEAVGLPQAG